MEFPDWTRAYVMMGDSPVGIREVLLAEDGSMYALLQGETALGALQTVRLDDQGRISAFIIDSSDAWGRMLSIGNAELAVRLGSFAKYDRRGSVEFAENFERGLQQWLQWGVGGSQKATTDPTQFASGGYSCKITTGPADGNYTYIEHMRGFGPTGRVGLECAFALATSCEFLDLRLVVYDGAELHFGTLRLAVAVDELQFYNTGEGYTWIADTKLPIASPTRFHQMKFVVDLTTNKYVRALFDAKEYDISAALMKVDVCDFSPQVVVRIWVESAAAGDEIVYVDDVIFTMAEP